MAGAFYEEDDDDYEIAVMQTPADEVPRCTTTADCQAKELGEYVVSARSVSSPIDQFAVFGQGDLEITDKLTLTLGARWFTSEQHNVEYTLQGLRFPGDPADNQTEPLLELDQTLENDKPSYNLSLGYDLTPEHTVYGRVASGFRQGGINNASFAAQFGEEVPAGFEPDEIWNYEIGAKGSLFGGMMGYEVAAYRIDWSDQQVPGVSAGGGFGFTTNAGTSVVDGFEVSFNGSPLEGLTYNVGVSYTDSYLTEDQPDTENNDNAAGQDGDQVPFVAKWTATGQARYEWPVKSDMTGYVQGNFNYRSEAYTFFNTLNPYYFEVGDYVLADIGAGVMIGDTQIGLLIQNVTDEVALTSAEVTPDGYRVTSVRPRNIGIRVSTQF